MNTTNPAHNADFADFDPQTDHYTFQGQEVTEELAEKLERKAARSGVPSQLIPGGKSLSGGRVHSPRIQVVVSQKVQRNLKRDAKRRGISVSKLVRRLVEEKYA